MEYKLFYFKVSKPCVCVKGRSKKRWWKERKKEKTNYLRKEKCSTRTFFSNQVNFLILNSMLLLSLWQKKNILKFYFNFFIYFNNHIYILIILFILIFILYFRHGIIEGFGWRVEILRFFFFFLKLNRQPNFFFLPSIYDYDIVPR